MEIFCASPFPVATLAWDRGGGQKTLSVCVKATLVLAPGTCALAAVQDPVGADGAVGDAPDLVPFKPRPEILFSGHAYAPGGVTADSLIARARIGAFRKSLSINGDRTWVPAFDGLRPSPAVPFRRMPLAYERAVRTGENLAGVDISRGAVLNAPLANIAAIADQGGETPGLTPLPFGWRSHRIGLTDRGILWAARAGLALGPPPDGFDFHIFNAAPAEQQVDQIPPGCDILLENLHPEYAKLETRLPWLRVRLFHRGPDGGACAEVPAACDTLWIDTDRGLAILLFRGLTPPVGTVVVVAEPESDPTRAEDVDRLLARLAPTATYVDPSLLREDARPPAGMTEPIPLPPEPAASDGSAARGAPTTLAPPAAEGARELGGLPFRVAAPFGGVDPEPASTPFDEVTPPRGYPAPPPPFAPTPEVATPLLLDDAGYAVVRMEAWVGGGDLGEVLAQRRIEAATFHAHEASLAAELTAEAEDGGTARAIAVLDALLETRARS